MLMLRTCPRTAVEEVAGAPRFVVAHWGDWVASAEVSLAPALRACGLLEPSGLREALQRGGGAIGRHGTSLATLSGRGQRVLLRPLRRGGLLGPVLRGALFDPLRPFRELTSTARLRDAGAPVPAPALAAAWSSGAWWNGVVGTLLEEDAEDALAFLEGRPERDRLWRALLSAGRATRRFHDAGGVHPDLHVKNLLVSEHGDTTDVLVVDLDRVTVQPEVSARERMAELMRLHRSLRKRGVLEVVGARGCARFLHAYVDDDRELRRCMLRRLAPERRRAALHALRYRS